MVMVHTNSLRPCTTELGSCGCACWMTTDELVCGVVDLDNGVTSGRQEMAAAADIISRKGKRNYCAHARPSVTFASDEQSTGVTHEPDTS